MPNLFRDYAFKFLYHLESDNFRRYRLPPKELKHCLIRHLSSFEETYFAIDTENPYHPLDTEEKEKSFVPDQKTPWPTTMTTVN